MVTGKKIIRSFRRDYVFYHIINFVFAAIAVFWMIYCAKNVGWLHFLTFMGIIGSAFALLNFFWLMKKLIFLKDAPLFQRYGSADEIAEHINEGLNDPIYHSFKLILTRRFIMNEGLYDGYLELNDIERVWYVHARLYEYDEGREIHRDPAKVAGTLNIIDNEGKAHGYHVREADWEMVLKLLQELVPHIQITY